MNCARRDYYSQLISENSADQRKLFRTTKSLLCEPSDVNFPNHIPPNDLANNFGNYFMQKIDVRNKSMDSLVPREDGERSNVCDDNCACAGAIFSDFEALNEDQVAQLKTRARAP